MAASRSLLHRLLSRTRWALRTTLRLRRLPHARPALPPAAAIHPFDLTFGVDTSGLLRAEHLVSGHRNDAWATAYYAIAPSVFEAVMTRIGSSIAHRWDRFAFVDLGSGKGRAVLLAARLPFLQVLGVELNPELHRIAEHNLRRFSASRPLEPQVHAEWVRLMQGDAAAVDYPPVPLVIFLYNPFQAPVLRRCLYGLRRSLREQPREAWVAYVNAEEESAFRDFPELRRVWEHTFAIRADDLLADRHDSTSERVVAFHFAP